LARSRAAASLTLTVGLALVTLVVMGAVLVGPTIADCAGDSLAACLRDRVVTRPAPEPPRPVGWLEVNATEYEPPPPAAVTLTAPAGTLALAGAAPAATPPAPAAATLAALPGELTAAAAPPTAVPAAPVLLAPVGAVAAIGTAGGEGVSPATAALAAPIGSLSAGMAPATPPMSPAIELHAPEKTISSPIQVPKIEAETRLPVIRFDPAFPNVVVLPAPNTGPDSSIRMLETR